MPLYRPPSEGNNLIFQVTLGCSFNRCSFCSMYRTKAFSVRPLEDVLAEINRVSRKFPGVRRIFLADGDALAAPTTHLLRVLEALRDAFPVLERVSSYALPANLRKKSLEELTTLREHKLSLLYYGIETGSADLLKRITKGATPHGMIEGLHKAKQAGLSLSATAILGLGGKAYWREHIDATADLVNQVELDYLSTLQLGLDPMIRDEFYQKFREPFEPQDDWGMLEEQTRLLERLDPPAPLVFRSNHASNALALAGTLPADKEKLMATVTLARSGRVGLRPMNLRGY
ncbi:MAG: radical SAM protein [Candidatus Competibacteraceae bacterium]